MRLTRRTFLQHALVGAASGLMLPRYAHASNDAANVIWMVNDASRAASYSCYGYNRPTSPNLVELASAGVLFEQAYSNAFWTSPSVSSYMTAMRFPNWCTHYKVPFCYTEAYPHLIAPAFFAQHGYETIAFSGNGNAITYHPSPLREAFGRIWTDGRELGRPYATDGFSFNEFAELLERHFAERGPKPFFLYMHGMETHSPWVVPDHAPFNQWIPEYSGKLVPHQRRDGKIGGKINPGAIPGISPTKEDAAFLRGLYDGAVRYADECVGRIMNVLDDLGLADNTIVVYTSDHGESLLEDGRRWGHSATDGGPDETHHVPLVITGPGVPKGARVAGPVESIDIFPTLVDLCGLGNVPEVDGVSLCHAMESGQSTRVAVTRDGDVHGSIERIMLVDGKRKAEWTRDTGAYNIWTLPDLAASRVPLEVGDACEGTALRRFLLSEIKPSLERAEAETAPRAYYLPAANFSVYKDTPTRKAGEEDEFPGRWFLQEEKDGSVELCFTPTEKPGSGSQPTMLRRPTRENLHGPYTFYIETFAGSLGGNSASQFEFGVNNHPWRSIATPVAGAKGWVFIEGGTFDLDGGPVTLRFRGTGDMAASCRSFVFFTAGAGSWDTIRKQLEGNLDIPQSQEGERLEQLEALGYV